MDEDFASEVLRSPCRSYFRLSVVSPRFCHPLVPLVFSTCCEDFPLFVDGSVAIYVLIFGYVPNLNFASACALVLVLVGLLHLVSVVFARLRLVSTLSSPDLCYHYCCCCRSHLAIRFVFCNRCCFDSLAAFPTHAKI